MESFKGESYPYKNKEGLCSSDDNYTRINTGKGTYFNVQFKEENKMNPITKKYKFTVGIGYPGSCKEEIVEVVFKREEYTYEQDNVIKREYLKWRNKQLDGGWDEVD